MFYKKFHNIKILILVFLKVSIISILVIIISNIFASRINFKSQITYKSISNTIRYLTKYYLYYYSNYKLYF